MENGVDREGRASDEQLRPLAADSLTAVLAAESAISDRVATTLPVEPRGAAPRPNAFGDPVTLVRGVDAAALARDVAGAAGDGARATLIASPADLAAARADLRAIARRRLPLVFHAMADRGLADAFALADLGWGLLFASGVEDSIDLALVARRAAEDSGTPFLVVHERPIVRHVEPVAPPAAGLCEAFLGARAARVHKLADAAHPTHAKMSERAFSERVPFALGSAMRGLEALTGRRHDLVERTAGDSAPMMLVGAGALGEALLGEAERLKAAGHDVGAVKVTALRPFPGPRLIRALARAHVVTVLETVDEPFAQSNPLTREVKAAFADALTWAPDYPGIGRLPRIHAGVVSHGDHDLESGDLDAIVRNMIEGDQGKRLFVMSADPGLSLARPEVTAPYAPGRLALHGEVADARQATACAELCATVIASALALKCRASIGKPAAAPRTAVAFDLVASRERPRGVATPHAVGVVAMGDPAALIDGNPLARITRGGLLAIPTMQSDAAGLWGDVPVYVKAIAHDRHVRIVGFPAALAGAREGAEAEERRWLLAAVFAGVTLFAQAPARGAGGDGGDGERALPAVDGSLVEREVADALRGLRVDADIAGRASRLARRVFEAPLEVPRALVEQDQSAIRLGRHDARAGVPDG